MEQRDDERAWRVLERVVNRSLDEQRRARRWGIFFKLLTFAYLFAAIWLFVPRDGLTKAAAQSFTAMVRVDGVIAPEEMASANNVVAGLRAAFEEERAKAVMLVINSPGGSPVQSDYVYNEIRRLREKHPDKKLYAVIGDIGASGAYYIAAAADQIYAAPASLVGSIGVISGSFGVTGLMEKLGIERRLVTAGENKALLDPFSPFPEQQRQLWQSVVDTTHRQFVERVKRGRGDRLKDDPLLFSGMVWSGEQALALGLIDGLGSPGEVAREVIGTEEIVDFSRGRDPLHKLLRGFGVELGAGLAQGVASVTPQLR
jgi:protease-4